MVLILCSLCYNLTYCARSSTDRALVFGTRGWGFDSLRAHKIMDTFKNLIQKIPKEVSHVTESLEKAGFEAYLVGGCVRDLLMDKEPKDWDITTNAKPAQ